MEGYAARWHPDAARTVVVLSGFGSGEKWDESKFKPCPTGTFYSEPPKAPQFTSTVNAQTFPTRPITMISPFPAGGPNDAIARTMSEAMREVLCRAGA